MVKIFTPLAVSALAGLSSASALYLVTQSTVTNGKQGSIVNQLIGYDNNTVDPCTSSTRNAFCQVAPGNASTSFRAICNSKYSSSQSSVETVSGIFQNARDQVFMTSGSVNGHYKDGPNFFYNAGSSAYCRAFSCQLNSPGGSTTITSKGFRCYA